MISPILPSHDADTIALDFGVFIAEQAKTYRVSQPAIISALRALILPPPTSHAAAAPAETPAGATTDGEGVSSSLASPSVPLIPEPQPNSTPAVQEHIDDTVSNGLVERPTSPPGAEGSAVPAPLSTGAP